MYAQLRGVDRFRDRGDPHFGHGDSVRTVLAGQGPHGPSVLGVGLGTNHHIVVVNGFDQLIECGAQSLGNGHQLVQGDTPVTGFDAAERGGTQIAAGCESIEGPPTCGSQALDALSNDTIEIDFLRHAQECMPLPHEVRTVEAMTHDHHHHAGAHHGNNHGTADILDLDAEVLQTFTREVLDWVTPSAGTPRTIVDLGSGTGTWTLSLAEHFTDATVTAVDVSEDMLARTRTKADERGLTDRVRTAAADLDAELPDIHADLFWAALSLHEVTESDRLLRDVFAATRPGGAFTIIEMEAPPTFLPHDIGVGRPGLEVRIREAMDKARGNMPLHPDWGPRLEEVGFESAGIQSFTIDPAPPYPESVVRYADTYLRRVRPVIDGKVSAEDLSTLDALLADDGQHSLRHRQDFEIRGSRTVWVARKPKE